VRHEVVVADLRKDTTHQRGNNKDDCYYLSVQPSSDTHRGYTEGLGSVTRKKKI
jgi:hypothetical protein